MKKINKRMFFISVFLLITFVLWTIAVCFVDVDSIGPKNSDVGFAAINSRFHNFTGVNFTFYNITDWLSIIPLFIIMGFGTFGFFQLIKRKSILKVDYSILILGVFYIVTLAIFFLFEIFVINYRPVLINGILEASYPSSTTMLVMCVMPTALIELNGRIKNKFIRKIVSVFIIIFIIFMVVLRLFSGVHWLTDIIGGAILSAGLVMLYYSFLKS